MTSNLSSRLFDAFSMIPSGEIVMDIGADRGLLAKELAKNGFKVYASENKKGPFSALKENTRKECQDYSLECIFTDGIDILPSDVTLLSMMGMGGNTIYDVLQRHQEKLGQISYILIEPQSDYLLPLEYLLNLNYHVVKGKYVFEKRYYPLLLLKKEEKKMKYTPLELLYCILPLREKDLLLKEHLLKEKERLLSLPEDVREKKEEEIDNVEKGLRYYE